MRRERWILRQISWQVPRGACAAILGPNGSGKSTLTRILAGHLWPTDGVCRILGEPFGQADLAELRRSIRLIQPAGPYDIVPELTAREVVLTGFFGTLGLYESPTEEMVAAAEGALEQVGLSGVADHRYDTMSSGERVRSLIARALVVRPKLLLLDETTAGLDLLAREQVLATVQALVTESSAPPTVVFITHHLEELPPATSQVLLLSNGTAIAQGRPTEVLTGEVLSRAYQCAVEVHRSHGRFYLHVQPEAWKALIRKSGKGGEG